MNLPFSMLSQFMNSPWKRCSTTFFSASVIARSHELLVLRVVGAIGELIWIDFWSFPTIWFLSKNKFLFLLLFWWPVSARLLAFRVCCLWIRLTMWKSSDIQRRTNPRVIIPTGMSFTLTITYQQLWKLPGRTSYGYCAGIAFKFQRSWISFQVAAVIACNAEFHL